ncbi:LIM domain transcription factor LMO4.1-like [Carcharodon carcharias]|uniref:LIM domain transcription factor LMO4.1-like n=1 Tax=Carcharodon carcharias TaxID=13397 RepID=UPI001B7E1FA0|nr:LIM domain transcription factor LMO4.1-like [Carcharodon carcharias]
MVNSQSCGSAGGPSSGSSSALRTCAGCGLKILERFLLYSMERYWHTPCLKCSCCQVQLAEIGTSCYTKSGMILCRNDYIRLFGNGGACRACGRSIPSTELVMRARDNVYHLECFSCATCRNKLVPGDSFRFIDGTIFCEQHQPPARPSGPVNPRLPDHKGKILEKLKGLKDIKFARPDLIAYILGSEKRKLQE